MTEIHHIFGSEKRIAGQQLVSNSDTPYIYAQTRRDNDGVREFSVRADIAMEREAISQLMQKPTGTGELTWEESYDGLKNISYPHRRILALSRSPAIRTHLGVVGPSAMALAKIMVSDKDTESRTANLPVFSYGEAQKYSAKQIYGIESERRLLLMLKSVGLKPELAQKFGRALFGIEQQSTDVVRQLEELTGTSGLETQVAAILNEAGGGVVSELINRYQYENFVGFPEQSRVGDKGLIRGSDDLTVFIREEDIPSRFPRAATNVSVGAELRDKQGKRRSGYLLHQRAGKEQQEELLTRHQVTFYTQASRTVAYPEVVWRRTADGERSFSFRTNNFIEYRDRLARPSSLAGVALIASTIGKEMGIDYYDRLKDLMKRDGRTFSRHPNVDKEMGRLWPIIANYREEEILSHPYFESIEKAFEYVDLEDEHEKS